MKETSTKLANTMRPFLVHEQFIDLWFDLVLIAKIKEKVDKTKNGN